MGRFLDIGAALLSIGAGVYLLQYNADTAGLGGGTSWFQIIGHGMGVYFIGKGVFIARATHLAGEQAERLRQLVEFAGHERVARAERPHGEAWPAD